MPKRTNVPGPVRAWGIKSMPRSGKGRTILLCKAFEGEYSALAAAAGRMPDDRYFKIVPVQISDPRTHRVVPKRKGSK